MFFVVVTILFELFIILIALIVIRFIQNMVLHEVASVCHRFHIVTVFVDVVHLFFQLAVDSRQILDLIVVLVFEH